MLLQFAKAFRGRCLKDGVHVAVCAGSAAVFAVGVLVLTFGFSVSGVERNLGGVGTLLAVYEPSGAQQLPDGRVIVVEDEARQPLQLLSEDSSLGFTSRPLGTSSLFGALFGQSQLGKVDDLEGVDVGPDGYVYAITSHSRNDAGKRKDSREKLIRFRVDGDEIAEIQVVDSLRKVITKKFEHLKDAGRVAQVKDDNGLNIEALSFDKTDERLLIGLRSPVIDGKGVVVVLQNPVGIFERNEKPRLADELLLLDLGKGGLRAIEYDAKLDGYLILSRREDKKNKAFKLWFWDGQTSHAPRRIRITGAEEIDNAEGVTPLRYQGEDKLLIVFDDGNALRRRGAHYLLLDYDQLHVAPAD